ncbi:hypothetical protein K9L97_03795 [Candidatus Woesearchaeota archaeon]|nr:hypothetical protein [Candidatus Woesearchaeota archaeon]
MLNKRGVSPLIVTIVLIAFAVALGTMIMSWGSNAVQNRADCSDVEIEFQKFQGKDMICFDINNSKLNIILKNSGNAKLEYVMYRYIKPNFRTSEQRLANSDLAKAQLFEGSVGYEGSEDARVEFIPAIKIGDNVELCPDKGLVVEQLAKCVN